MDSFKPLNFQIEYENEQKKITAKPHPEPVKGNMPVSFEIAINGFPRGKIKLNDNEWETPDMIEKNLVKKIGETIESYYK